jgi:hypothetical protein
MNPALFISGNDSLFSDQNEDAGDEGENARQNGRYTESREQRYDAGDDQEDSQQKHADVFVKVHGGIIRMNLLSDNLNLTG